MVAEGQPPAVTRRGWRLGVDETVSVTRPRATFASERMTRHHPFGAKPADVIRDLPVPAPVHPIGVMRRMATLRASLPSMSATIIGMEVA